MWVGKEILWKSYFGKSYCNFCATRSQYSEKINLFYKLIYFNWIELIIEYQMDRLDNKFGHPLGVSFKHTISSLLLTYIILYWSLFFCSAVTSTRSPLIQFNSDTELVPTPQVKGKVLHETALSPHFRCYLQVLEPPAFVINLLRSQRFPQLPLRLDNWLEWLTELTQSTIFIITILW